MEKFVKLLALAAVGMVLVGTTGCKKDETDADNAVDQAEEAMDDAAEAGEDAMEEMGDAME